jgi:hypothetical protein
MGRDQPAARFRVARHVLLREDEQALALLCGLLAEGNITQADVGTWPLFDKLRAGGRIPDQEL